MEANPVNWDERTHIHVMALMRHGLEVVWLPLV
jgi:hypothetical protein